MKDWGQLALWCSHPLKHPENLSCLRQTPRQTWPGKTVRERGSGGGEREKKRQKEVGEVEGVAETESLNVLILISTSVAGKMFPSPLGHLLKWWRAGRPTMNQTPPVRYVLHRDTHGQILSSLDCSDAFGAGKRSGGLSWESVRVSGEREGERGGEEAFLSGYTLA